MYEEGTPRPSSRAVQRLASDVGGEVADLRSALRRALDEADRHEADGRPDRAAAVLAEQQEVLAAVHRRLEDRLAEAAVEREAEGVLAAADRAPTLDSSGPPGATDAVVAAPREDEGMGLRLLASAAAAVVGMVLLMAPDAGSMLTVAGWSSIEEPGATGADGADDGHEDRGATAEESPTVGPAWTVLHDLAIPEASELGSRAAPDDPAPEQDVERDEPSPPEPVDGPIDEVLDELGDLDELVDLEDLASTEPDTGDAQDEPEDEQQDEPASEGSSTMSELGDIAPSDDETGDAGR